MTRTNEEYGEGSATYDAVGGMEGLTQLVIDFYEIMDESSEFSTIREMHPDDLLVTVDKLVSFLSGWMGGEELYSKKYGSISIPGSHYHLDIGEAERDMWLACMREALDKQDDYPVQLKDYLMKQFAFPAELIRSVSQSRQNS